LCVQLSRKQAAMRVGLCGCISLVGVIWALVVLVCVLGFRGNKPGVVAKRFTGDEGDSITILPCVGSVVGPCLCFVCLARQAYLLVLCHGRVCIDDARTSSGTAEHGPKHSPCPGHVYLSTVGWKWVRLDLEQVRATDLRMKQSSY
jgi:hypothetical protein